MPVQVVLARRADSRELRCAPRKSALEGRRVLVDLFGVSRQVFLVSEGFTASFVCAEERVKVLLVMLAATHDHSLAPVDPARPEGTD